MKFLPIVILSGLTASLVAEAPKNPTLTRYARLWTNSPFTNPPPPPERQPDENPLDDYALGGISKLNDGYYAILINKKNPNEKREFIRPGSKSEFEVVEVKWSESSWKDTVAVIRHGTNQGTVKFEKELLTVKTSAPTQQQPQQPGLPPGVVLPPQPPQPGQPPQPQATDGNGNGDGNQRRVRTPRPRVVVPPRR